MKAGYCVKQNKINCGDNIIIINNYHKQNLIWNHSTNKTQFCKINLFFTLKINTFESMLDEIVKKHKLWLSMAIGICKDTDLANDLVQEMYIKILSYNKELNDFYIYYTIKHIFIDYLRTNERRTKAENKYNYLYTEINEIQLEENEEKKIPDCLTWVEQQILIHRHDKSCRDIEKEFNINFLKVHRIEKKAKEKIKQWVEEKKKKDQEI